MSGNMREMLPGGPWPLVAALACACLLGGLATDWALLLHLGYVLAGFLILAFLLARAGLQGLSVTAGVDRARTVAGTTFEEHYTVAKEGAWPAFAVEIGQHEERADGGPLTVSLGGGEQVTRARTCTLPRRGLYPVASGRVYVRDPFGLFVFVRAVLQPTVVTVLPRPIASPAHATAVRAMLSSAGRGGKDMTDASPGDLRGYVPGDPPSRIHWRSTARRGTLMVTDPEVRRRHTTWLLVDLGGETEAAEAVAGVTAFLVEELAHRGGDVGAIVAGASVVRVPAYGGWTSTNRILDTLAAVQSAPASQLERLVRWVQPGRTSSAFVLITARPDYERVVQPLRGVCSHLHCVPVVAPGREERA